MVAIVILSKMRKIEINLYKFEELSEEAQAKAIKNHQLHSEYEWWDSILINAEESGVIIESFDTDKEDISVSFKWEAHDVANALVKFWGADSDIGKIGQAFIDDRAKLYDYHEEEFSQPQNTLEEEEDSLVDYFHSDVSHYFLKQLRDELEWIESDEYAREYLSDMDYDFMEDGTEY
jgi:hypothetical protein